MKAGASAPLGAHLKALREAAGYTQEELATIAGLSVHAGRFPIEAAAAVARG